MHTHDNTKSSFVPPVTKTVSGPEHTRPFRVASSQLKTGQRVGQEITETRRQSRLDHADRFSPDLTKPSTQSILQRQVKSDLDKEDEEKAIQCQVASKAKEDEEEEDLLQREVEPGAKENEQEEAPIQPKLTMGQPGDKYEQEADSIAQRVMAMRNDEVQARVQVGPGSPKVQAKGEGHTVPAGFEQQLASKRSGGSPLSNEIRAFMEPRFGADFSGVRIHQEPELTSAIQAQAFTHGQDIYFNSGKYNPGSSGGKKLLAHELTHVVQQNRLETQSQISKQEKQGDTFSHWLRKEPKGRKFQEEKERLLSLNKGYRFILFTYISSGDWKKIENRSDIPWNSPAKNFRWHIYKGKRFITRGTTENIASRCRSLGKSYREKGAGRRQLIARGYTALMMSAELLKTNTSVIVNDKWGTPYKLEPGQVFAEEKMYISSTGGNAIFVKGGGLYSEPYIGFILDETLSTFPAAAKKTEWILPYLYFAGTFPVALFSTLFGLIGTIAVLSTALVETGILIENNKKEFKDLLLYAPVILKSLGYFRKKCPKFYSFLLRNLFIQAISSIPEGASSKDVAKFLGKLLGGLARTPEISLKIFASALAASLGSVSLSIPSMVSRGVSIRAQKLVSIFKDEGIDISLDEAKEIIKEGALSKEEHRQQLEKLNECVRSFLPALETINQSL